MTPSLAPVVRGHCPGALTPMASGDGLLMRIRPQGGWLSPGQLVAIADAADRWADGTVSFSNRANLGLRGLTPDGHTAALEFLGQAGLIDPSPEFEARRNILVTPLPLGGRVRIDRLASSLKGALAAPLPVRLPAKFGFAIDCADQPWLMASSADIRIEGDGRGGLLLVPDGQSFGWAVTDSNAVPAALQLAIRFVEQGGAPGGRGRMARLAASAVAALRPDLAGEPCPRIQPAPAAAPGLLVQGDLVGRLVGFAFGDGAADGLRELAALPGLTGIRVTPWRGLVLIGVSAIPVHPPGLITSADDPLWRVFACSGAPACNQGVGETRPLAQSLASTLGPDEQLHVSGCAKGCAHPGASDRTVLITPAGPVSGQFCRAGDLVPVSPALHDTFNRLDDTLPMTDATSTHPAPGAATVDHHIRDGAAIYRQSFAIIRAEADLARFDPDEEPVVVRMIHACGLVGLEKQIRFTGSMATIARKALIDGAPILCDSRMLAEGITRRRLPADNQVLCTLNDAGVPELAASLGTTRSAAAVELWRPHLEGAIVAVGNAPTALFHLLAMLRDPATPRPAAIIGCPVGFVGAAESKEALLQAAEAGDAPASLIVSGRLGGTAIAAASLNALASRRED